jgi:hypothetical protein
VVRAVRTPIALHAVMRAFTLHDDDQPSRGAGLGGDALEDVPHERVLIGVRLPSAGDDHAEWVLTHDRTFPLISPRSIFPTSSRARSKASPGSLDEVP